MTSAMPKALPEVYSRLRFKDNPFEFSARGVCQGRWGEARFLDVWKTWVYY